MLIIYVFNFLELILFLIKNKLYIFITLLVRPWFDHCFDH